MKTDTMTLTELIRGRQAVFIEFHSGNLFYCIDEFRFPVPVDELDGANVGAIEPASVLMKWVRRAYKEIQSNED